MKEIMISDEMFVKLEKLIEVENSFYDKIGKNMGFTPSSFVENLISSYIDQL